jgi:hypothetical protein
MEKHPPSPHIRNIALDIILTLITCFMWNIYVQYKQICAMNDILKEQKYDFVAWFFFTVITCGLYHIYHEYRVSTDLARVLKKPQETSGLLAVILTFFGVSLILDAIQQSEINAYFGSHQI